MVTEHIKEHLIIPAGQRLVKIEKVSRLSKKDGWSSHGGKKRYTEGIK